MITRLNAQEKGITVTDVTSNAYLMAREYARRGWAVIPLQWIMDDGRCSCADGPNPCSIDGRGDSAGKHPARKKWTTGAALSPADLYAIWADEAPRANVGIRTGVVSGFFVLDVDPKSNGFESLAKLVDDIGPLPATHVVRTGSGGYHYYFHMPDFSIRNSANRELLRRYGPGLDIRGDGGQVVAPPSVSVHGTYRVQVEATVAAAPEALLTLLRAVTDTSGPDAEPIEDLPVVTDLDETEAQRVQNYAERTIEIVVAEYRDAPPGTGNDTLFRTACSGIEIAQAPWNTVTLLQVRLALEDAAKTRRATHPYNGGQDNREFEQVWLSARNRTVGQGRALPVSPSEGVAFDPFSPSAVTADPFAAPLPVVDGEPTPVIAPSVPAVTTPTATIAVTEERAIEPAEIVKEPAGTVNAAIDLLPMLPASFYERRPWLKELRRIAYERMAAPDAVLGSWLGLVSSQIPPGVSLDTSIGAPITASLYVMLVAMSGGGKTMAAKVAKNIYPHKVEAEMLASGEGIVEAFWGNKKVQDPITMKFSTVRAQIYTNKFFKMDEGQGLLQMEKRVGNLTGAILRSAWSGDDAGQSNATPERKRKIAAGTYNLGLVMGMQYEIAAEVLADTSLGTPQRFLWFSTDDPAITADESDNPFQNVVNFTPHPHFIPSAPLEFIGGSTADLNVTTMPMTLEASIRTRLREGHAAKQRGEVIVDAHDSQKPVSVGKLALVITYLDGGNHVTEDTWSMAEQIYENSVAVREQLLEVAADRERDAKLAVAQEKAREKQAVNRYGGDQVDTVRTVLKWIADGKDTRRAIIKSAKGARRELLADVLTQLVKGGHLREINVGNRQIKYERVTDWTP